MFCSKCGAKIPDGTAFCGKCGQKVNAAATQPKQPVAKAAGTTAPQTAKQTAAPPAKQTAQKATGSDAPAKQPKPKPVQEEETPEENQAEFDEAKDAKDNKVMAILAYILFFIPLITGDHKKSPFVLYHTNQGTLFFILWVAFYIVLGILQYILIWVAGLGFFRFFLWLFWLIPWILGILGILNAANGRKKPLPIIGKFTIIKGEKKEEKAEEKQEEQE